jgi:hypothetical protein
VGFTALPASASTAPAVGRGWYGSAPFALENCGVPKRIANSANGGLWANVCLERTRSGTYSTQPVFVVQNTGSTTFSITVQTMQAHAWYGSSYAPSAQYTSYQRQIGPGVSAYCAGVDTVWSGAPQKAFADTYIASSAGLWQYAFSDDLHF